MHTKIGNNILVCITLQFPSLAQTSFFSHYQGAVAGVLRDGNGETNSSLGGEDDDEDDVVPKESDPESIHAQIIASRKNREKFAIKKSYSIEVRTNVVLFTCCRAELSCS